MRDYEDVRTQAERMETARADLQATLARLGDLARRESRKATPDVASVLGLVGSLRRAEEDYDIARLDLETARGADA